MSGAGCEDHCPCSFLQRILRAGLRLYRDECGVVMLETVLVFPLQLLLTMIIIQVAHMYVAANVLQYAAYQGTRTCAINLARGEDAAVELGRKAAWTIASTMNNTGGGGAKLRVQGFRYIYPDYDAFGKDQMAMTFGVTGGGSGYAPEVVVWGRMVYWLDLNVPVGGPFVYHVLPGIKRRTRNVGGINIGQALMQQNASIPKTWPH